MGWVWKAGWAGVDISEFPNLKKWEEMLEQREAISKGRDVPKPHSGRVSLQDEEENESKAKAAREWILRGMKEIAESKPKV